MVAIPISESEVIVVEARRKIGYDKGQAYESPDGARTTYPADYPILVSGQSVTTDGYTITVVSTTPDTTITITHAPKRSRRLQSMKPRPNPAKT
jgi:hypothetical protein